MKEQTKYEEKKINRTSDFFELIHLDRFLISNVLLAYVFDGSSRLSFRQMRSWIIEKSFKLHRS